MEKYISKGTISSISEVISGTSKSGNSWRKVSFVIEIPGYRGNFCKQEFSLFGDDIEDLQGFNLGDKVLVGFNYLSIEYNGRWYPNIRVVEISLLDEEKPAPALAPAPAPQAKPIQFTDEDLTEKSDDLPL